jgi:hypothetical protein
MDLWLTSEGYLAKNASGELLKCDDCPCSACDVATTSFLVKETLGGSTVFSPTTVTRISSWPWPSCGDDPITACMWSGVVETGLQAGRTVCLFGFVPSIWFVIFRDLASCSSSLSGTDTGQVEPAGNYTNSITVV